MVRKHYMLIQGDEDGNPVRWLTHDEVDDIAQLMEDYGVKRWLDDVPPPDERDPSYWNDGRALLLEVRVLRVKPKTVVETWSVE